MLWVTKWMISTLSQGNLYLSNLRGDGSILYPPICNLLQCCKIPSQFLRTHTHVYTEVGARGGQERQAIVLPLERLGFFPPLVLNR